LFFLREIQIEERLPVFLDAFDVVLLDDQTMDVPNEIIRAVARGT
jgi:L-rhamnose isomerase